MVTTDSQLIVVDAANVVGSRPDGWWRDRPAAARRLITKLTAYQALSHAKNSDHTTDGNDRTADGADGAAGSGFFEMVVVLEGAARAAMDAETGSGGEWEPGGVTGAGGEALDGEGERRPGGVRLVAAAGSGDDAIVAVVAAAVGEDEGRAITVVTADRGLRERVEALGASTVGPRWLWDRVD